MKSLENQPDFLHEKSQVEIETKRGHGCIFYPKFHCDLNYIEYYWGAIKRYTRENSSYSFAELEDTVRAGFDSVGLRTIRRFANRERQWIDAYLGGLNEEQVEFVEMQKSSHRRAMGGALIKP